MGALGFAKTIFIPAIISLTLYLLIFFLILPFFRRYHQRYSSYLPLDSISIHTTSLRDRAADAVMRLVLRSSSSWRHRQRRGAGLDSVFDNDEENDTGSIDDEQGDMMVGMDMRAARREALEEHRRGNGTTAGPYANTNSNVDSRTRLSRDLEEGFMDDTTSDDEEDDDQGRIRRVQDIRGRIL